MSLQNFIAELDQLAAEGSSAFQNAGDAAAVEAARIEFLGAKSGRLKTAQKGLGGVPGPDKPEAGKRFNEVKARLEVELANAQERLSGNLSTSKDVELFDPTLPGGRSFKNGRLHRAMGHLHPLTQTIEELKKDIMGRLGFTVADGPEIEDEWHNFEALNIPGSHPARDPLENFYLATANVGRSGPMLLRSQTSTVQIRVMEQQKPPVRIISLGRVYRPDDADATHYPMFHQIEGLLIDRNVTMADLKSVLKAIRGELFGTRCKYSISAVIFSLHGAQC